MIGNGAIEGLLPPCGGKARVDDRRVISGIVCRFREGLRWRAVPEAYGPWSTLFNRFNRWSARGVWPAIFAALAAHGGPPAVAMADSTSIKAHRSAAGGKGGRKSRRSAARAAGAPPSCMPSPMEKAVSTPCC